MTFQIKIGKDMTDKNETTNNESTSGWAQMWSTLGWIVFVLACFSYCCRKEIVQVLQ